MRAIIGLALGLALAVVGSIAVAGSSYTPPAASGGGVDGDGTGVTDASAFRTALGLGTAATLTAGTAANNAVQLDGAGKLPAVDGSALTNVSAAVPSASAVPYTPADGADWSNPDPTQVAAGLDAIAARMVDTETITTDPEVSSLADLEWSSGTQIPAYLGSGTSSLLTVGSGALNIVQLDGTGKLPAVDGSQLTGIAGGGGGVDVQVFTADDTWTKPSSGTYARIACIGGGGGGGSGPLNASSTGTVYGGGGGGGGAYAEVVVLLSVLGSTETVTIGQGGAGGERRSSAGQGLAGTAGGTTTFGSHVSAAGGSAGTGTTGSNGTTGGANAAGGASTVTAWAGGTGEGAVNYAGGGGAAYGGGGGGAGGRYASGGSGNFSGLVGGAGSTHRNGTGAAGGTAGTTALNGTNYVAAGAGTSAASYQFGGGGGGGGPGQYNTANVPDGADGGLYGGGGGGGGPSRSSNSGKGGDGADGICVVVTYP